MPKINITGIIMPHNWDEDGHVVQIAIYTNQEEIYLVESNRKGLELSEQINRKVEATGEESERLDGKKNFKVTRYKISEKIVDDPDDAGCRH